MSAEHFCRLVLLLKHSLYWACYNTVLVDSTPSSLCLFCMIPKFSIAPFIIHHEIFFSIDWRPSVIVFFNPYFYYFYFLGSATVLAVCMPSSKSITLCVRVRHRGFGFRHQENPPLGTLSTGISSRAGFTTYEREWGREGEMRSQREGYKWEQGHKHFHIPTKTSFLQEWDSFCIYIHARCKLNKGMCL